MTVKTPTLAAPTDLQPKTATVFLQSTSKVNREGAMITIESTGSIPEITLMNNTVRLPSKPAASP